MTFISKFYLNVFGYAYAQLITLAIQLLLVPVYLSAWGANLYGDWLVITGVSTMLSLLDFGVAQASANKATMESGAGDWGSAARTIQNSHVFSFFIGIIIFILLYLSTYCLDFSLIFKTSVLDKDTCSTILLFGCANLVIQLMGGPLDAWYRAVDATAMGAFILANRRAADFFAVILVLLSPHNDPAYLIKVQFGVQILMYAFCCFYVMKKSPFYGIAFSKPNLHELKCLIKPSIGYSFIPISQVITLQGSIQLINQFSDSKTVVMFSMARTLMRLVLQVGMVVNNALKPELSRMIGAGNLDNAGVLTRRITLVTYFLSSLFFALLIVFGPYIMDLWSHSKVVVSRFELLLIGMHAMINILWFVPSALYIARNSHFNLAKTYMVSSVFSLLLWFFFSGVMPSFLGAVLLLSIPEFVVFIFFIWRLNIFKC